ETRGSRKPRRLACRCPADGSRVENREPPRSPASSRAGRPGLSGSAEPGGPQEDGLRTSSRAAEAPPPTPPRKSWPRPFRSEITGKKTSVAMASSDVKPKSISRAKKWSEEIENLYRFQQAGYRDEIEYKQVKQVSMIDRWPETGYVKKLQRRDNTFYYYNKQRECDDKEVHKVKIYAY
uniref:Meiosis/spermiosis associated 1 n=2 Tax=Equus asinus TaxID=9793 RepID=A0A9L0JQJ3_EQUAS